MDQFPDQTTKQRHEFRYALCAAEKWPLIDVFLGDIEPIFPQRKPPVANTSPLADALSAAAYMGHMDLVQKLLHEGADLNFGTGYLKPPLQQAASRGHNDILLLLLSKGADINSGYFKASSSDCGALDLASLHGHERTVKILFDCRNELQPGSSDSWVVSYVAIRGGHLNLVNMYLESEISTCIKNHPWGCLRMLRQAVCYGHEHIVRWLLQNGVDITKNNPHAWNLPSTPLEFAALHGQPSMVRLLLEYNVNRHVPALANAAKNGHVEVAKLLLDTAGEDIDIWSMLRGKKPFHDYRFRRYHESPLYHAVCNGEVEMVRLLLGRGIEKHFHVIEAVKRGEEEILRLLLEAEMRVGNKRDYTELLTWVRKQKHIPKRILDLLLELSQDDYSYSS